MGLTAGCYGSGFELNECATMIRLEAMLTEEGLERVDEVNMTTVPCTFPQNFSI